MDDDPSNVARLFMTADEEVSQRGSFDELSTGLTEAKLRTEAFFRRREEKKVS